MSTETRFSSALSTTEKRWLPWVGVGLMYLWCCAIVIPAEYFARGTFTAQAFGLIGVILASASGLGIAIACGHYEERIARLHQEAESARLRIANLEAVVSALQPSDDGADR